MDWFLSAASLEQTGLVFSGEGYLNTLQHATKFR